MTAARKAALKKAQEASARKRRGTGKSKKKSVWFRTASKKQQAAAHKVAVVKAKRKLILNMQPNPKVRNAMGWGFAIGDLVAAIRNRPKNRKRKKK
jgi:hypothetical protein